MLCGRGTTGGWDLHEFRLFSLQHAQHAIHVLSQLPQRLILHRGEAQLNSLPTPAGSSNARTFFCTEAISCCVEGSVPALSASNSASLTTIAATCGIANGTPTSATPGASESKEFFKRVSTPRRASSGPVELLLRRAKFAVLTAERSSCSRPAPAWLEADSSSRRFLA